MRTNNLTAQYNVVIAQNQSLQQEINHYRRIIDQIKSFCAEELNNHYNNCSYAKGCVNHCGVAKEVLLQQILQKCEAVQNV